MLENQNIIVLGMHRSGTSLVAGILFKFNIFMGEKLLGKNHSNPSGHFEDQNLITLNDQILAAAGGTWQDPPDHKMILQQADRFQQEIMTLVAKMPPGTWGWKDPRLSLTIELYFPYFNNPVFIICRRESSEIAKSLYHRDRINIKHGLKISDTYYQSIEDFFIKYPGQRQFVVHYEEISADPDKIVGQIIHFLQLKIQPKQYLKAIKFVMPKTKIRMLFIYQKIKNIFTRVFGKT